MISKQQAAEGNICIFHQRIRALEAYQIRDTKTGVHFTYGLCPICVNRLKKQESFKQEISDRLEELAEKLYKKQEQENAKSYRR